MKNSITSTYACLDCRKSFKKYKFTQLKDGSWEKLEYVVVCPQCGGEVFEAGSAFKAPKQKDVKAWLRLEPLLKGGYKFTPGCGSPFGGSVTVKTNKPKTAHKTEFRKPARKRQRLGKNA